MGRHPADLHRGCCMLLRGHGWSMRLLARRPVRSTTRSRGFWSAFFFIRCRLPRRLRRTAGAAAPTPPVLPFYVSVLHPGPPVAWHSSLAILANALMASAISRIAVHPPISTWWLRFMPVRHPLVPVVFTQLVVAIVHAAFSAAASCCCRRNKNRQDPPAMSQSSDFTSLVRQLPHRLLRAHVIMGAIQITVWLPGRTFSGFWTFPVFIAAGPPAWLAAAPRSNTRCCLIGCLMLSSLAANRERWRHRGEHLHFGFASYADILWLLAYLLETVVAIVQVVIASRAVCCRFPPADSSDGRRGPPGGAAGRLGRRRRLRHQDWQQLKCGGQLRNAELLQLELEMEIEALSASHCTAGLSGSSRMKAAAAGSDVILSSEEPPVSRAPGAGHVNCRGLPDQPLAAKVAFVTALSACWRGNSHRASEIWNRARSSSLLGRWGCCGQQAAGAATPLDFALAPPLSAAALCACRLCCQSAGELLCGHTTAAGCAGRQRRDVLLLLLAPRRAAGRWPAGRASALSSSEAESRSSGCWTCCPDLSNHFQWAVGFAD
uniref:RING-type domain-containing protein n=1 Tax=Macrostomum lignano TaxID=282301 RepID=A0A1I8JRN2_9PLAT